MRKSLTVASVLILAGTMQLNSQDNSQDSELERRVDNTIREMGVVESANSSEIRSPVESKIQSIVSEGDLVEKGDLLVTLHDPALEQQIVNVKITQAQSKAKVAEVQQRLNKLRSGSTDEIALLEKRVNVAKLNLNRFTEEGGELDLRKKEVAAEHAIAEQRLKTLNEMVERVSRQIANGNSSPFDLTKIQIELLEAQKQVDLAISQQELIEKHVAPHEIADRELEVQSAVLDLKKSQRDYERHIQAMEAELKAAEMAQNAITEQLTRLNQKLSRGKITAPQTGIIVYENQNSARTSRDNSISVGSQLRENQIIMRVVDLSQLQLKVGVHESRIARVKIGQPVIVRVDAFPQRAFNGEVLKISQTPETASWPYSHIEYNVTVSIEDAPESLRLGLTAMAEIDASK